MIVFYSESYYNNYIMYSTIRWGAGGIVFDLEYSSRKYIDRFFEYYLGVFQKRKLNPQFEKQIFSGMFFDHILCHDH